VKLINCSTELILADAVTKELSQERLTAFVNPMVLEDTKVDQSGRLDEDEAVRPRSERERT